MTGGQIIRSARRAAGLSQQALAERLGTQQPVVARWETGARSPAFDSVSRAVRAAGFDLVVGFEPRDPQEERLIREFLRLTPRGRIRRNRRMLETERWAQQGRRVGL